MNTKENQHYNTSEINQTESLEIWRRVMRASEDQQIIQGKIERKVKQGFVVDIFDGIKAFLPGSQIGMKRKPDPGCDIIGKTMDFKIIKINDSGRNVIVSHRIILDEKLEARIKEIWATIQEDQTFEGRVKNITSYGAFIDLGGVDGLLHISDICWKKINHPKEVLKLDQKIKIIVLKLSHSQKRVWLGRKQLLPNL